MLPKLWDVVLPGLLGSRCNDSAELEDRMLQMLTGGAQYIARLPATWYWSKVLVHMSQLDASQWEFLSAQLQFTQRCRELWLDRRSAVPRPFQLEDP